MDPNQYQPVQPQPPAYGGNPYQYAAPSAPPQTSPATGFGTSHLPPASNMPQANLYQPGVTYQAQNPQTPTAPQTIQPAYQGYQTQSVNQVNYGQPYVSAPIDYTQGSNNYGAQPATAGYGYAPQTYDPYSQFGGQAYGSVPSTKRRLPFPVFNTVFVGVLAVTLLVAGFFGISRLSADSPDDVFYAALENQMKLKSMHVVMTNNVPKLNSTTKVNYYLDVSDPARPLSAGTVENAIAFLRTKTEVAAEFNASQDDVYVKFITPAFDKWVITTASDKQLLASTKAINISRVRDLSLAANNIGGIVMSGQFPKQLRSDTLKALKSRSAYTVVRSETVSEGDTQLRKYIVKINRDVLREIQKGASDSLGVTFTDFSELDQEFNIFVDTKRKFITKIDQSEDDSNLTYVFSEQNQTFQATPPSGAVGLDQYLAAQK